MHFYVGLHQPSDAKHFARSFISVNRIRARKSTFEAEKWIMDSGAFTEISTHGEYRHEPEVYAEEIVRWARMHTGMICAVSQDWMCEPWIVNKTGLSVAEHQHRTTERYFRIKSLVKEKYVMPVLQGYHVDEYVTHLREYGKRLVLSSYVGVGSVCKRNTNIEQVARILIAIKRERPDLRLHGFGLKTTALSSSTVRACLFSSDSMAWSFAARKTGRNANDWREALGFVQKIESMPPPRGECPWLTH